jgi:hypothetical protein
MDLITKEEKLMETEEILNDLKALVHYRDEMSDKYGIIGISAYGCNFHVSNVRDLFSAYPITEKPWHCKDSEYTKYLSVTVGRFIFFSIE